MPDPQGISVEDLIRRQADALGVPPELALAVAEQESGFNPTVSGPPIDAQGTRAIGTFQLLPSTAQMLKVDRNNPVENIRGGVTYLRQLLDANHGDLNKVLATYGGVKSNTTYVPQVLARLPKFTGPPKAAPPPAPPPGPAPGSFAAEHPWIDRLIQGVDPNELEGRQNIAGGMGGALGGFLGIPLGPWGIAAGSAAGAGLFGAAEQALIEETGLGQQIANVLPGSTDIAVPPPEAGETALGRVAKAGAWQTAYDIGGQALSYPLRYGGKRLLETRVGRFAQEYYAGEKQRALEALHTALDALRGQRDIRSVELAQAGRATGAQAAADTAAAREALRGESEATRLVTAEAEAAARAKAAGGVEQAGAQTQAAREAIEAEKQATQLALGQAQGAVTQAGRLGVRDAAAASLAAKAQARAEAEAAEAAIAAQHQALVGTPPSEPEAGRRVAEIFQPERGAHPAGPGQRARDIAGQEIKAAAKMPDAPEVDITDLYTEADRIAREELLLPEQKFPREPQGGIQSQLGQPPPAGAIEGEVVGETLAQEPWTNTNSPTQLFKEMLDHAKARGYTGTVAKFREAFQHVRNAAQGLIDDAITSTREHGPRALLEKIKGYGGIGEDKGFPGEIKWLWEGSSAYVPGKGTTKGGRVAAGRVVSDSGGFQGVTGVLRKDGLSLDRMAENLRQEPGFAHIKTPNDLLEALRDAIKPGGLKGTEAPTLAEAMTQVGAHPGSSWWEELIGQQAGPHAALSKQINDAQLQQIIHHPAMAVINRILNAPQKVDFYTAHLWKSQLEQALAGTYDDVVKSQVTNITQHLTGKLRAALAAAKHEPYEAATAAYADIAKLFTEGHAPLIREVAVTAPEKIVQAISADSPTAARMLVRVLTEQAEIGGGAAGREAGQQALQSVQEAWLHRNVLRGSLDGLGNRVAALKGNPEFVSAFQLDSPFASQMIDNVEKIAAALEAAKAQAPRALEAARATGRAGLEAARDAALAAKTEASEAAGRTLRGVETRGAQTVAERQAAEEAARTAGEQEVRAVREAGARTHREVRTRGREEIGKVREQGATAVEAQKQAAEAEKLGLGTDIREQGAAIRQRRAGTPEELAFEQSTLGKAYQRGGRTAAGRQFEWAVRAVLSGATGMYFFGPWGTAIGLLVRSGKAASEEDLLRYAVRSGRLTDAVVKLLLDPRAKVVQNTLGAAGIRGVSTAGQKRPGERYRQDEAVGVPPPPR